MRTRERDRSQPPNRPDLSLQNGSAKAHNLHASSQSGALSEVLLMAKVKQITVPLENKPGTLAHVTKILADAKVNIVALFGSTVGGQGSAQLVVDNFNKAKEALSAAGVAHSEGFIQQFELLNKPGALAQVADRLAKKGANIDSIYATAPKGATKAVVVLATTGPLL